MNTTNSKKGFTPLFGNVLCFWRRITPDVTLLRGVVPCGQRAGFTLIEVVVSLALGVVVALMILVIVSVGLKNTRSFNRVERVHAGASQFSDVLTYWVKQASDVKVPAGDELVLTLPDGTKKTFKKDGENITLEGNGILSPDVEILSLAVTKLSRSVRLSVELKVKSGEENLEFIVTAAQRNSL